MIGTLGEVLSSREMIYGEAHNQMIYEHSVYRIIYDE